MVGHSANRPQRRPRRSGSRSCLATHEETSDKNGHTKHGRRSLSSAVTAKHSTPPSNGNSKQLSSSAAQTAADLSSQSKKHGTPNPQVRQQPAQKMAQPSCRYTIRRLRSKNPAVTRTPAFRKPIRRSPLRCRVKCRGKTRSDDGHLNQRLRLYLNVCPRNTRRACSDVNSTKPLWFPTADIAPNAQIRSKTADNHRTSSNTNNVAESPLRQSSTTSQ